MFIFTILGKCINTNVKHFLVFISKATNIDSYKIHKNENLGMGRGVVLNNWKECKGVPR